MGLDELRRFSLERLAGEHVDSLAALARKSRVNIVRMISSAGSGHIGGSLSSLDIYVVLWTCANVGADVSQSPARDRIVVSHGHTSAAVYSVLGNLGYCDIDAVLSSFRRSGSVFEGHPCLKVPGVDWCSGSLGQGLSVGCGFALASRIQRQDNHVFVVMGDGEQEKGQITEARELASKYGLGNLTAIIDANGLQASGELADVMPQDIPAKYRASGWRVFEVDGHDYAEMYAALRTCYLERSPPTVIIAHTHMGKGVSFIEDRFEYHGKTLTPAETECAIEEVLAAGSCDVAGGRLGCELGDQAGSTARSWVEERVQPGTPVLYEAGQMVDCRSAFGTALVNLGRANRDADGVQMAVVDCDLADSLKLRAFAAEFPEWMIECGIQEHNAATVAGALSRAGVLTFFADFGVFGIDETYGQHRMNDFNDTSLKLIVTHNGLDVGEDGKTHQCIDYVGIISNLFGYRLIIPADANQTDRVIRYVATHRGNFVVAMGRSRVPVLADEDGAPCFDADYRFTYGQADWLRPGHMGTIVTCGTMVHRALAVHTALQKRGLLVGVLNLTSPTQLDEVRLRQAASTGLVVTYEDHNVRTGIGVQVGTYLAEAGLACRFRRLGISGYGASADSETQYRLQSLDQKSLEDTCAEMLFRKNGD